MSETKNPGEKKLSVGKLTLKPRTETGVVRQSFSHGRSKQVVVEKVKRRSIGGAAESKPEPALVEAPKRPAAALKAAAAPATQAPAEQPKSSGVVLRTLTEEERVARAHALADSRVREAEERKIAEEEARRRSSRDVVDKTEREAADARKRDEDERRKHDEETKRKADEIAKKRFGEEEEAGGPRWRSRSKTEAPRGRAAPAAPRVRLPPVQPLRVARPQRNAAA
jgi:translation initiation factor IF-2